MGQAITEKLVEAATRDGHVEEAMLYIAAYAFLLRVPSEALPMVAGMQGAVGSLQANQDQLHKQQAVLSVQGNQVILTLKRRKNKPRGSIIRRECWCATSRNTCPRHKLGAYLGTKKMGNKLFPSFTPAKASERLRARLSEIGIANANTYKMHDFRRGHTKDMQDKGACLRVILDAGEWRSPAFLAYMDKEKLEHDAVVEAHLDESSSEEE